MKIKVNNKEFDYSAKEEWMAPIKKTLAYRVTRGTKDGEENLEIFIFNENESNRASDNLPQNIFTISLGDVWVLQYRTTTSNIVGTGNFKKKGTGFIN